jgi:hypothetical protein
MSCRRLVVGLMAVALAPGCHHLHKKGPRAGADRHPAECDEEPVVRVKAPPQKIVVELPDGTRREVPDAPTRKESADLPPPVRPESAGLRRPPPEPADRGAPESAPAGRPESALGAVAAVGQGLALANQIAGFSRTTALTNPLGTVTPGSAGLGIGLRWIHIPIPFPRLFSVQETPSVTVPLTEANLIHAGGVQQGVVGGGRGGITREELAALVEQEVAARARAAKRDACPPPAAADEEKKRLEKKLAEAEGKIERLSRALDSIDDKLTAPAGWGPASRGNPR